MLLNSPFITYNKTNADLLFIWNIVTIILILQWWNESNYREHLVVVDMISNWKLRIWEPILMHTHHENKLSITLNASPVILRDVSFIILLALKKFLNCGWNVNMFSNGHSIWYSHSFTASQDRCRCRTICYLERGRRSCTEFTSENLFYNLTTTYSMIRKWYSMSCI